MGNQFIPDAWLQAIATLGVSFLFGGMLIFSIGLAPFLFSVLPITDARLCLRKAFPHFYFFVILTSAITALVYAPIHSAHSMLLALVSLHTVWIRQKLMPAINQATDTGNQKKFKLLHALSVAFTLSHILLCGYLLV